MKIVNTNSLRVKQLEKNKYLTWTPNFHILFVPKIVFELTENGNENRIKIVEFGKSILLNLIFLSGVILLMFYFKEGKNINLDLFVYLLTGIAIFLFIGNFIIIETTKRLVRKQLK
jgi:uncharacterized protein with PQ loop repeat